MVPKTVFREQRWRIRDLIVAKKNEVDVPEGSVSPQEVRQDATCTTCALK